MGLFDFFKKEKNNIVVMDLHPLADPYVDEAGKEWQTTYKYDDIEVEPIRANCKNVKVNQAIEFRIAHDNLKELNSVEVLADGMVIGYLVKSGQRYMIRYFMTKDEALVRAQVSVNNKSLQLQIYYYRSKKLLDKQKASCIL